MFKTVVLSSSESNGLKSQSLLGMLEPEQKGLKIFHTARKNDSVTSQKTLIKKKLILFPRN
jgi:hypothetical protein